MISVSPTSTTPHGSPVAPTLPKVPLEVCERIIDILAAGASEQSNVLLRLSLVGRGWLPRVYFHLYHSVNLSSHWRTDRFIETLTNRPERGVLVKKLEINGSEGRGSTSPSPWVHKSIHWLPNRLPNLRTLSLRSFPVLHHSFFMLCPFRTV